MSGGSGAGCELGVLTSSRVMANVHHGRVTTQRSTCLFGGRARIRPPEGTSGECVQEGATTRWEETWVDGAGNQNAREW